MYIHFDLEISLQGIYPRQNIISTVHKILCPRMLQKINLSFNRDLLHKIYEDFQLYLQHATILQVVITIFTRQSWTN